MRIIIWDLPEEQVAYLRKNCAKEFASGKICQMQLDWSKELVDTSDLLVISQNVSFLREAVRKKAATIAYQRLGSGTIFPPVDIIAEGFEEIDGDFLEKIYQRHHRIPWTILETKRLIVRELDLKDLDDLFALYAYEGMTDYIEGLYSYEEEYAYQRAYIENMYRFFGYGIWLVFEKETKKLIGRAGIEHREELNGELELGYVIGKPWQGKGYATEVCEGILNFVKEILGFEEIFALVRPENQISVHILEKLGFYFEKEVVLSEITYKKFKKSL